MNSRESQRLKLRYTRTERKLIRNNKIIISNNHKFPSSRLKFALETSTRHSEFWDFISMKNYLAFVRSSSMARRQPTNKQQPRNEEKNKEFRTWYANKHRDYLYQFLHAYVSWVVVYVERVEGGRDFGVKFHLHLITILSYERYGWGKYSHLKWKKLENPK